MQPLYSVPPWPFGPRLHEAPLFRDPSRGSGFPHPLVAHGIPAFRSAFGRFYPPPLILPVRRRRQGSSRVLPFAALPPIRLWAIRSRSIFLPFTGKGVSSFAGSRRRSVAPARGFPCFKVFRSPPFPRCSSRRRLLRRWLPLAHAKEPSRSLPPISLSGFGLFDRPPIWRSTAGRRFPRSVGSRPCVSFSSREEAGLFGSCPWGVLRSPQAAGLRLAWSQSFAFRSGPRSLWNT